MDLSLEVLDVRDQKSRSSARGERKIFGASGGTIGRNPDNTWVLPDSTVSGRHARIAFQDGVFSIEDTSTNGVFINSLDSRLGTASSHVLASGDNVIIGPYTIGVTVVSGASNEDDPFGLLSNALPSSGLAVEPDDHLAAQGTRPAEEVDPLKALNIGGGEEPERRAPSVDALNDVSPLEHHYSPPVAKPPIPPSPPAKESSDGLWIGDDFLDDDSSGGDWPRPSREKDRRSTDSQGLGSRRATRTPEASPPPAAPPGAESPIPDEDAPSHPAPTPSGRETPSASPKASEWPTVEGKSATLGEPIREDPSPLDVISPPVPAVPPSSASSGAAGGEPAASNPQIPDFARPKPAARQGPEPLKAPASPKGVQPPLSEPVSRTSETEVDSGLAELLAGAGLEGAAVTPELAHELGQILRVVVSGVMDVLRARALKKDELRMSQTRLMAVDNNPLKFSADVNDALHNLLVKQSSAYLRPVRAFEEAFDDLRNHQMAELSGMQSAFESMLAELEADHLEAQFDRQAKRSSFLRVLNKLRYWDMYRDMVQEMTKDPDRTFRTRFGEPFAEAYDEHVARIKQGRK